MMSFIWGVLWVGGVELVKQGIFCCFLSPREHAEIESITLNFGGLNVSFNSTLSGRQESSYK